MPDWHLIATVRKSYCIATAVIGFTMQTELQSESYTQTNLGWADTCITQNDIF